MSMSARVTTMIVRPDACASKRARYAAVCAVEMPVIPETAIITPEGLSASPQLLFEQDNFRVSDGRIPVLTLDCNETIKLPQTVIVPVVPERDIDLSNSAGIS